MSAARCRCSRDAGAGPRRGCWVARHLTGTGRVDIIQGDSAIRAVTAAAEYRVLIYTHERRREVLAGCLAVGAHGVVRKAEPLERVTEALAAVARGEVVVTTALAMRCPVPRGVQVLLPDMEARSGRV